MLPDDTELVAEINELVAGLPTYGYRRVWALLRRSHELNGAPCVNAKRVYRVMRDVMLAAVEQRSRIWLGPLSITTNTVPIEH